MSHSIFSYAIWFSFDELSKQQIKSHCTFFEIDSGVVSAFSLSSNDKNKSS